tara:strand:- start:122 stop:409 length:288 start_codon:yes stop_codon:yes gene_type:complete
MTTRQRFINHKTYGVGYAILTKYREESQLDLWMCSFYSTDDKHWFCTKHFSNDGTIGFISEAEAKVLRKQPPPKKRTKTVREEPKDLQDFLDKLR